MPKETAARIEASADQPQISTVEVAPTETQPPEPTFETLPGPSNANRAEVESLYLFRRTFFLDVAQDKTLKTGPGVVRRVVIGAQPAGMNGVLVLRDGTSASGSGVGTGRVIARLEGVAGAPVSLQLDAPFEKGLTVTLSGATPGSWSVIHE